MQADVAERARTTMLREIEFRQADVREAIRLLCRESLFGCEIAPDVQGTVTMRLQNVSFEVALQNLTRQVDASYRIDHGFFEIVRKPGTEEIPFLTERRAPEMKARYADIALAVAAGRGVHLRTRLSPTFEFRDATEGASGERAVRALIDLTRGYPIFRYEWTEDPGHGSADLAAVVSYRRGSEASRAFRDSWHRSDGGVWRLVVREKATLGVPRLGGGNRVSSQDRFLNARLSEILRSLSRDDRLAWTLEPTADRRITVDLTGLDLGTALSRAVQAAGVTYWIEAGVYHIVSRENPSSDLTNVLVPSIEFEKTELREALHRLFRVIGADFIVDPMVQGTVTLDAKNVAFETILQNLTRQVNAAYRIENGVFHIIPRGD